MKRRFHAFVFCLFYFLFYIENMKTPDAIKKSIVDYAPKALRPYLQLSRFDRPIGFWLLGLPCLMGQLLGRVNISFSWLDLQLIPLWALGAIAMRGAGCTINDIADKDFDAQVERTKNRPLASGALSLKKAYIWLGIQLLVGLFVLLLLPRPAQIIALLSLPMIIAYPFMKRITWWPQAWLGMTFNWGILVGFMAVAPFDISMILFWLGAIFWTLGYDTIYAMSDVQDDALIGVKSTARRLGDKAIYWCERFYWAATFFFGAALIYKTNNILTAALLSPLIAFIHFDLMRQINNLKNGEKDYTKIFRSNQRTGLIIIAIILVWVIATAPHIAIDLVINLPKN